MRSYKVIELVDLGVKAKREGNYNSALNYYEEALRIDASDFETMYAMGKINFILGNYYESVKNYGMGVLAFISDMELYEIRPQSIIEIARHCGNSLLADYIYKEKIEEYYPMVEQYRYSIDPYYHSNSGKKIFMSTEYMNYQKNNCVKNGLDYFNQLGNNNIKLKSVINILG